MTAKLLLRTQTNGVLLIILRRKDISSSLSKENEEEKRFAMQNFSFCYFLSLIFIILNEHS
jgi:hypothetical protein